MLLEVEAVSVNFGGLAALKSVSFTVEQGQVVSVIGPNGAGKTTLFNVVTGFRRPSSGQVRFGGTPIIGLPPHKVAQQGLIRTFQKTEVFPALSVMQCVRIGLLNGFRPSLYKVLLGSADVTRFVADADGKVEHILAFVGLRAKAQSLAMELSYGEQRLLEIAVGLAARPRLLLLDEPSSGLNAEEANRFIALVRDVKATGVTVLLVEHNMNVVMRVSDHIVVLHHGEKIAEGDPSIISQDGAVITAYLGREWVLDAVG